MSVSDARVRMWGRNIGAVSWLPDRQYAVFQYEPAFVKSNIQLSPLMMPLRAAPYYFPSLSQDVFKGLPGMLADSLPDKYGNALINEWLALRGRSPADFSPVERLCYVGTRGMGALEFEPAVIKKNEKSHLLEIAELVELANLVLAERNELRGVFNSYEDTDAIQDILRVGTSAGGARAKAVLAWNPSTNEFKSGQVDTEHGFEHWLMKFDGIANNRDKEVNDPKGFGCIEYAYYKMAVKAGIEMSECRLHAEGGRNHFMTRRFDRTLTGNKLHMQSLGAIAHYDFNQPDSYSYEQAVLVMKQLGLPRHDIEQQFLRAVFNVIGQNNDDHVKNIAFLMNKSGTWRLSPAFDVTYAYNPDGMWTSRHQMSLNKKRTGFSRDDLLQFAEYCGLKKRKANTLIEAVKQAIGEWPIVARDAGVFFEHIAAISKSHLLSI